MSRRCFATQSHAQTAENRPLQTLFTSTLHSEGVSQQSFATQDPKPPKPTNSYTPPAHKTDLHIRHKGPIRGQRLPGDKTPIIRQATFQCDSFMPKRKTIGPPDLSELDAPEPAPRKIHDPEEVRIYIKALKRALRYLPLGSRAYYYVSGEIHRASTQLKTLASAGSPESQGHGSPGSSSHSRNDGN